MKKFGVVCLLVASTVAVAGPTGGQDKGDRMFAHMKEKLELTDVQADQVKAVFEAQGQKMKVIREEGRTQVREILTPEQVEKLDAMKEKAKKRFQSKRGDQGDRGERRQK